MNDEQQAQVVTREPHRLGTFIRKHPMISMLGVGGIALLGGAELAAGVLIGAGGYSLLRRGRTPESESEAHHLRERTRAMMDRVPQSVRDRTRAFYEAAREKLSRAEKSQGEPTTTEPAPPAPSM